MNSLIPPFAVDSLVERDVIGHVYPIGSQRVAVTVAAIQLSASAAEHAGDIRQTQQDRAVVSDRCGQRADLGQQRPLCCY
jgi:hypothetical protein